MAPVYEPWNADRGAGIIAEHARRGTVTLADTYKSLKRYRLLEQGDAALSFYRQPIETSAG